MTEHPAGAPSFGDSPPDTSRASGGAVPAADREVLTGRVVRGESFGGGARNGRRTASMVAGDLAGAAAARAHQLSELLSGTTRLVAGLLGASVAAGALAAVLVTVLLAAAFDWSTTATGVVLVVLLLPPLEVAVHRALLLRAFGDPAALRKRFTDLPDATVGRVAEFTGRVHGVGGPAAPGSRRGGRLFGAARSANALRGITEVVPELTGALLLPLTRPLLLVTAVCAGACWVLLVLSPVVALVALGQALIG